RTATIAIRRARRRPRLASGARCVGRQSDRSRRQRLQSEPEPGVVADRVELEGTIRWVAAKLAHLAGSSDAVTGPERSVDPHGSASLAMAAAGPNNTGKVSNAGIVQPVAVGVTNTTLAT